MAVVGAILGAVSLLQAQASVPAPPAREEAPHTVEGVVITARPPRTEEERREAAASFVRQLSDATVRSELARWGEGTPVCPGIVGLPAEKASYILDRLAEEALALGLQVGAPGCRPSVMIVVTARPDAFAAKFREDHPGWFEHLSFPGESLAGGGGQRLGDFLTSSRPVRWWHVAKQVRRDHAVSRLTRQNKDDLARALVIVDPKQLQRITYEQLAGYLTMTVLAQTDPTGAPQELPTITTLFADRDSGRTPQDVLTTFDRAYLRGLYADEGYSSSLHHQKGRLRRSLVKASATER